MKSLRLNRCVAPRRSPLRLPAQIALALCPLLLIACGPPPPTALDPMPMDPAPAPAPIGQPIYDPGYDMQQLQGTWEARWGGFVIRREIVGNKEQVAYYNAAGQLSRSHTADIEVAASGVGTTQTLRWSNLQSIVGPPATPGTSNGDYQFDVNGARMTEYHRSGPKTETIVWTRISGPPAPFAPESPL